MCIIGDKVLRINDDNTKILVMMGQVSTCYTGPNLLFQPSPTTLLPFTTSTPTLNIVNFPALMTRTATTTSVEDNHGDHLNP